MNKQRDPVDSALDLLRSDEWTGSAYNPELENRLMQEFNRPKSTMRLGRSAWILAAVALVAVSGVSFAAVGGVEKIKTWFVTVEFDGQSRQVELSDDGEAVFTIETEDGTTAQVHVKRSEESGRRSIEASVTTEDGFSERKEVCKKVRVTVGDDEPEGTYTLEDIGDAEPIHTWTDDQDVERELYMLPNEEDEGALIYLVAYDDEETPEVRQLAATPHIEVTDEFDPKVSVDDNGMITVKIDDGMGRLMMLKFRTQSGSSPDVGIPTGGMIDIDEAGEIKIKIKSDLGANCGTEDEDIEVRIEG